MTVGFRFHPNDHEIINHYLGKKMDGQDFNHVIAEVDLCRFDPWELPGESVLEDDEEWYFFCRRDYKYKNSKRANRTTKTGYWKPTGKVRSIKGKGTDGEIGTKRTLVFYCKEGASKPLKTTWVIHEYQPKTILPHQREFILCKLKDKSDDQTDKNSPTDEGEQSHRVVFGAETDISPATIDYVDEELILQPPMDGIELDFDDLFPEDLRFDGSPNRVTSSSSEDEFVASLLVEPPEEYVSEARSTLPNDYRPQRPLSAVCYVNCSDMENQVVHEESLQDVATSRLRPIGRIQTITETFPRLNRYMDERRTTGFDDNLQINVLTRGRAEMPKEPRKTEVLQVQHRPLGSMAQNKVSSRTIHLQGNMSSTKSRNQVEKAALRYTGKKQGLAMESQESKITAKVTGANQDLEIKSSGSLGSIRKVSFIHMEAPTSINRTGPPTLYVFNILVALVVFINIVGSFFTG